MGTLVTPAVLYLGGMPDPQTGQAVVSLDLARHYIDLIGVLEEKCQGNLTEDESTELAQVLSELRNRFVEMGKHLASMPPRGLRPAARCSGPNFRESANALAGPVRPLAGVWLESLFASSGAGSPCIDGFPWLLRQRTSRG